jgi:hypothetical protein
MASHKPRVHKCAICGAEFFGNGKYCPKPKTCRDEGRRRRNTEWSRQRAAGERVKPGGYGERLSTLKAAYLAASPEKRRDMREWHSDLAAVMRRWK